MSKVGDTVLYSLRGKTFNAIVLHVHDGQADHLGKNGEPLLHIAYIAPEFESARDRSKIGYLPKIFTEFDVVHYSHEFNADFKRNHSLNTPAQIAVQRGQGEYFVDTVEYLTSLDPPQAEPEAEIGSDATVTSEAEQETENV